MSVLPSRKLSIGELFVSMAVGLILYLLPGDIRNQTDSVYFSETIVFFAALAITIVFMLVIKRAEAVGAAMLTNAIITVVAMGFSIVNGVITKNGSYWPAMTEYQLVTIIILWTVPFLCVTVTRLFTSGQKDNNETRIAFSRFLSLSIRALMIIYLLILIFRQLIPQAPNTTAAREIHYLPFYRIEDCLNNAGDWGVRYLLWNSLLLMPLTFSLLIINPKIRWWQILFISFATGLSIEIFQFSLNTGTVYVDDLLLYLVGGMAGFWLKKLIDRIRFVISGRQERNMLSLDYTPVEPQEGCQEEYDDDNDITKALRESEAYDEFDNTLENPGLPGEVSGLTAKDQET